MIVIKIIAIIDSADSTFAGEEYLWNPLQAEFLPATAIFENYPLRQNRL
jgi:hypothetical protein